MSKRYAALLEKVDRTKTYTIDEGIEVLKSLHSTKFDETVELSVKLGIDPKKLQQPVRGSVVLPHGTGKTKRVLVFASGENYKKAQQAGADYVGGVFVTNVKLLSSYIVTTTGIVVPSFPFVTLLNCLQNSIILTPCCPSAGPTGGAGVACPAGICNFTTAFTFFSAIFTPLCYFFNLPVIKFKRCCSSKY